MSYAYVVVVDDIAFVVDCGLVRRERAILDKLREVGVQRLAFIYLTHAHLDHSGSVAALKRATGVPVLIHYADADALRAGRTELGTARNGGQFVKPFLPLVERFIGPEPCEPDVLVDDGDTLTDYGLDATVMYIPGHTPGHAALLVRAAGELHVFSGDLITSENEVPRLQRNYATDWNALIPSLERLQSTSPDYLYPGHGNHVPIHGDTLPKMSYPE